MWYHRRFNQEQFANFFGIQRIPSFDEYVGLAYKTINTVECFILQMLFFE
jgi:hypothetical protein